ncbi:MAG: hypothetical protein IID33_16610 [Planctomycetes bacterium]|nr:hypothetical protein [Planctomycetota bacterium]
MGCPPKYIASSDDGPLRQGEIVSNVVQVRLTSESVGSDSPVAIPVVHPFAMVLTQDCDLEQHLNRIGNGKPGNLPNLLFCEAIPAATLKGSAEGSDWKRVRQNKAERYQCLEQIPAELDALAEGVHALGVDFKRYFTIPTDEIFERIRRGEAKRRTCLAPPYNVQIAMRFFQYQMRIALPDEHVIPSSG